MRIWNFYTLPKYLLVFLRYRLPNSEMHVLPVSEHKALRVMILAFYVSLSRSQWPRGEWRTSAAARLLRLWVRIPPSYVSLSVVSVVCCQVEVLASSWSLVQRSPTDCSVWSRNFVNDEALAHWRLSRRKQTNPFLKWRLCVVLNYILCYSCQCISG